MGKHIRPFLSRNTFLSENEEAENIGGIYPEMKKTNVEDEFIQDITARQVDRETFLTELETKVGGEFAEHVKVISKFIKETNRYRDEIKSREENMIRTLKDAFRELEERGERFENNQYELGEFILRFSEGERTSQLSDKDKLEIFDILMETHKEDVETAINFGIQAKRVEFSREFNLMSMTPKRKSVTDEEGNTKVSQRYPSQSFSFREYTNEWLHESIFSSIKDFFTDIISTIKSKLFKVDKGLNITESNIRLLNKKYL